MELLSIEFLDQPLRLEGSMAGWQQLFWNNTLVSQISASADHDNQHLHEFELSNGESVIKCRVEICLTWQPFLIEYRISIDDQLIANGSRNAKDIERQTPAVTPVPERKFSLIGLASLGMKLLKSAKVIKGFLAVATLATYSWLFSMKFALALVACLVFHEYGHIRAMKYFGMKTKGIYLVPFFGGLALSDEKINTRWQDVVISIMGPSFGLIMSLLCTLVYWATGEVFFAGLAVFNALLNLFNLLPILPMDGGHVLKSIGFSMNSKAGVIFGILSMIGGIALCYTLNMTLFGFLLVMGSIEIFTEWKYRHHSHLLPLDRYGQIVSFIWYVSLVSALMGLMWYFAGTGNAMLGLPLQVLSS